MKNQFIILLLVTVFFTVSCKDSENEHQNVQEFDFADENLIIGLASPINLNTGSTVVFIRDFFPEAAEITQIKTHKAIEAKLSADSLQISLKIISDDLPKLSFLKLKIGLNEYSILLKKSDIRKHIITFNPDSKEYKTVQIKGEMNAWNPNNTNLTFENGVWKAEMEIKPGTYQYLFVIDGKDRLDPSNPDKRDNGTGVFNSVLKIGNTTYEELPQIFTASYIDNTINITSKNNITKFLVTFRNFELGKKFLTNKKDTLKITIPKDENKTGRAFIRVWAYNEYGISNDLLIPLQNGQVLANAKNITRTDFHSAVLYNAFVDRFNDGDKTNNKPTKGNIHPRANFHGGDITGITNKINDGYFQDLGINTIWISPVVQNPEGAWGLYPTPETEFSAYHGYWPISFTKIDARFGTKDELKLLVETAHKNNLNVLLDFVANHVHKEHPIYQQHKDWATNLHLPDGSLNTERWDDHRLTTWFDVFLPTLDLSKPEVYNMLSDSAVYWIKEYNLDGFRHDATKHIPEIFWQTLSNKLKKQVVIPENRKLFQIGETYGSPELISSYVNTGQLDAQFDFNVYDAIVSALTGNNSFENLASIIKTSQKYYGSNHLMGNITGNQDRGRFISYASKSLSFKEDAKLAGWTRKVGVLDSVGYDKCAMLNAVISTIPGIPVIFYGDEIGISGGNDPDNRKMMRFDNLLEKEIKLKSITKTLLHFRKTSLALMYGDFQVIEATENSIIYSRTYFDKTVYVIINSDKADKIFRLKSLNNETKALLNTDFIDVVNQIDIIVKANSFELIYN